MARKPRRPDAGTGRVTRVSPATAALDLERERAESAMALFLAVARLHEASGRADVYAALEEIAFSSLGGAEVAVWLRTARGALAAAHRVGPIARAAGARGAALAERAAMARSLVVEASTLPGACDVAVALGHDGGGALVLHGIRHEGASLPEELKQRIVIVGHHAAIALGRAP